MGVVFSRSLPLNIYVNYMMSDRQYSIVLEILQLCRVRRGCAPSALGIHHPSAPKGSPLPAITASHTYGLPGLEMVHMQPSTATCMGKELPAFPHGRSCHDNDQAFRRQGHAPPSSGHNAVPSSHSDRAAQRHGEKQPRQHASSILVTRPKGTEMDPGGAKTTPSQAKPKSHLRVRAQARTHTHKHRHAQRSRHCQRLHKQTQGVTKKRHTEAPRHSRAQHTRTHRCHLCVHPQKGSHQRTRTRTPHLPPCHHIPRAHTHG